MRLIGIGGIRARGQEKSEPRMKPYKGGEAIPERGQKVGTPSEKGDKRMPRSR